MATRTASHLYDCSTLANYKAWAMEISNAMGPSGFGWRTSGDTGIVNWSAVGASQLPLVTSQAPSGNAVAWTSGGGGAGGGNYGLGAVVTNGGNTYMCILSSGSGVNGPPNTTYWTPYNFEIWAVQDGLSPIYLKIEYWVQNAAGGSANSEPKLYLTASTTATGGAGVLTGFVTARVLVAGDAANTLTASALQGTTYWQPWYMSGSTGRAAFFLYANPGMPLVSPYYYNQQVFAIERDHDNTGADLNTGFTLVTASTQGTTTANRSQQSVNYTNGLTTEETAAWISPFSTLTITTGNLAFSATSNDPGNGSFGTVAFPVFPNTGGLGNQLLCVMLTQNPIGNSPTGNYDHGAVEEGAVVQVKALGSLHTYVAAGGFALSQIQTAAAGRVDILLVRFE